MEGRLQYHRIRDRFYFALRERDYGTLVTYEELAQIAGADVQADNGVRGALLKAGRRMLRDDKKLLVNRISVGYEIANPNEHATQARRQQSYARNRLRRGLEITVHVPLKMLEPVEQNEVLNEQVRIRLKLAVDRTLDRQKAMPKREEIPNVTRMLLKSLTPKN